MSKDVDVDDMVYREEPVIDELPSQRELKAHGTVLYGMLVVHGVTPPAEGECFPLLFTRVVSRAVEAKDKSMAAVLLGHFLVVEKDEDEVEV